MRKVNNATNSSMNLLLIILQAAFTHISFFFFFNDPATTEFSPLPLHAALPILEDATEAVPALGELELAETLARLRPGTPDNGPILGASALPGLVLATGHYRNGVLLTPLTADVVAGVVVGDPVPAVAVPFNPERFTSGGHTVRPREEALT